VVAICNGTIQAPAVFITPVVPLTVLLALAASTATGVIVTAALPPPEHAAERGPKKGAMLTALQGPLWAKVKFVKKDVRAKVKNIFFIIRNFTNN